MPIPEIHEILWGLDTLILKMSWSRYLMNTLYTPISGMICLKELSVSQNTCSLTLLLKTNIGQAYSEKQSSLGTL